MFVQSVLFLKGKEEMRGGSSSRVPLLYSGEEPEASNDVDTVALWKRGKNVSGFATMKSGKK